MNKLINNAALVIFTSMLLSTVAVTTADDTDIIDIEVPTNSNVLFVMDMSGSMSYELGSDTPPVAPAKSRKEVLHEALKLVLNDPQLISLNLNVGLASFAGNSAYLPADQTGHGISYPITPLTADAAPRLDSNALWNHQTTLYDGENVTSHLPLAGLLTSIGYMGDAIPAGWVPIGKTPIVDALYEAALYFRGSPVDFGNADPSRINSAHPSTYTGLLYDKTSMINIGTDEICGGTTGIVCNATVDSCPSSPVPSLTCFTSDPACAVDAATDGFVCGLPYTPSTTFSDCDLATCSATVGCNTGIFTTPITPHVCTLASASACETANPTWDIGSCVSRTVLEQPGACNSWDAEGDCNGYAPTIPEHTVYDCTETKKVYSCPSIPSERQVCTKSEPVCRHTIQVPTASTTLNGTATYNSPIKEECPNNAIILLSDGKPTRNTSAARVTSLVGVAYDDGCSAIPGDDTDIAHAGRCGKELTNFLANTDNNTTVTGDQFITTHTIGLSLDASPESIEAKAYLEELALNGGGQFINASTPSDLVSALRNTIISTAKARSFSSPTYTGSNSSMSHGDYVYTPIFDKSIGPVWSGNLKKYKRIGGRLVDADGLDATDLLGTLKATARDFWSATPSTNFVTSGGVANKLPAPDSRMIFTDAGVVGAVNFTSATELKSTNASVSKALLGDAAMTNAHRDELIDFIRGKKLDATSRKHMGDIIHSKPIFVRYATTERLFVGTNEGYIHSIDEATGVEQFAFMPSVLLKNIETQFQNDALADHTYGVDGQITLKHNDKNNDGIVNGNDTAVLFFGLRRGGKAYYALDVTSPTSPKLKWKIEQGLGDFNNLGYSWSKPLVASMKHHAVGTDSVVVLGGGYVDDNGGELDNSGTGADVFIVKASDGSLIWRLSDPSKTTRTNAGVSVEYAVPGNIRVMDVSRNGLLDRLYFGDTGGNIWRVDFEGNLTGLGAKKAKLKKFADLSGVTPKRKFFTEPDVAIFKAYGRHLISVAIGSGQRPNPLDTTTNDHFFMMFDLDVGRAPTTATPTITKANLKDSTAGPVTGVLTSGKRGWFTDLVAINGEKVLSRATTYKNIVFFNTFGVTSVSAVVCGLSNVNQSRLYAVDVMTGGAVLDLDDDSTVTVENPNDKSVKTTTGEIPDAPQVIFDKPSAKDGSPCVAGDCVHNEGVNAGSRGAKIDIPWDTDTTLGTAGKSVLKSYWIDKE